MTFCRRLNDLNHHDKARLLSSIGYEMTLVARSFYGGKESLRDSDALAVIEINEFQHRLLATISDLLEGNKDGIPVTTLLEMACNSNSDELSELVVHSLARIATRFPEIQLFEEKE